MSDNKQAYYIGLDMGTTSVGWAVTNEKYELLRKKGKDMWGVRLFDEAQTAADRRSHRVSRRCLARRKARIGYLRELFADEINKVDPGFYQRLEASKFYYEDKDIKQKYTLFNDSDFTDIDYFKKYPTIFHLRKALIYDESTFDVRLVFLAILNIFKHRGHFLNAAVSDGGIGNIDDMYKELCLIYEELFEKNLYCEDNLNWLENIISDKTKSRSEKYAALLQKVGITKSSDKCQAEMWKLLCGLKATLSVLFPEDINDSEHLKDSISFSDSNFEEKAPDIEDLLSSEKYEFIVVLKSIYDWSVLVNIMKGDKGVYQYLSDARVDSYEKHNKDLHILKAIYKKYLPDKYNDFFRKMTDNSYSSYVCSVNSKYEKCRRGIKNNSDEFFASIKKTISLLPDCDEKNYILSEIDRGAFLPKQLTVSNGVIPNQVHKRELEAILENAQRYLPFLAKKDDSGLSVSERIIKLFEFKIPYYIGPISPMLEYSNPQSNLWSVRKENGRVYPWNFFDKIDENLSREIFITKMVRHCTYLNNETVLPKNSLLYEKFMVLNELNNLRINGEKLSSGLKHELYNSLFIKGKKVTKKKLLDYLKTNGYISKGGVEIYNITGIDGDFANTCVNYARFTAAFNVEMLTDTQYKVAEDIVYLATLYGEEKTLLTSIINEKYGDSLSKDFIKRITGIKFKDWGRLSKSLLYLEGADKETGEIKTVINRMWDESLNLMELIASDKYTYIDKIREKQTRLEKSLYEIGYEDLEDLYISAPVKRMVWQTLLILKEIVKIMGYEPDKVFVEMARSPEEKKQRKNSRKNKLLDLYSACKDDARNWIAEISEKSESEFRSKKLYLYYTQMGRCMYTGEPIEISDLFNNNLYDIDHIYPRHFVKDDSIENNLVLVKKEENAHKTDNYPIEKGIKEKCFELWNTLNDRKLISDEKYKRLIRTTAFSEEEQADFIARQLVETRQGTKVITDIIEQTLTDCNKIIYSKASNVSEFRDKYGLIKCRTVSDFHHANDAYLNIVVGNVYYTKFTNNPINFIKEYRKNPEQNKYHMEKIFDYSVSRNGYSAWKVDGDKSINVIKGVMDRTTPLISCMTRCVHGGFFDENIVGKNAIVKVKGEGYTQIKTSDARMDVCKYGGYNKAAGSYFFLVEHSEKDKMIRTIEPLPLYRVSEIKDKVQLKVYCENELKYKNVRICLAKIPMNSLLFVDGFYLYLTGRSGSRLRVCNAVELKLSRDLVAYVKLLDKCKEICDEDELLRAGVSQSMSQKLYDELAEKYRKGIYSRRPNPMIRQLLQNNVNIFSKLSNRDQIYVLMQIISLSQKQNNGADLRLLGGSKQSGITFLNKKISAYSEVIIIQQSVTGLYENKIDLLKI